MVPQLASPIQLEEECRLAPCRLVGEHGNTGIVATLDTAASYITSSVCDCAIRRRRARSRDMWAEKEATMDVDEVMLSWQNTITYGAIGPLWFGEGEGHIAQRAETVGAARQW